MGKHDSATCGDEIASLAPRRDDSALCLVPPRIGAARETGDPILSLGRCDVATCVLDPALKLQFFTRSAQELLGIGGTDVGKPFARLRLPFADRTLEEDLRAALTRDGPVERDICAVGGRWYKRSAFSYLGDGAESAGVVVSFADATEKKFAALSVDVTRARRDRTSDRRPSQQGDRLQPRHQPANRRISSPTRHGEARGRHARRADQALRAGGAAAFPALDLALRPSQSERPLARRRGAWPIAHTGMRCPP
jgi:PAS domain